MLLLYVVCCVSVVVVWCLTFAVCRFSEVLFVVCFLLIVYYLLSFLWVFELRGWMLVVCCWLFACCVLSFVVCMLFVV